jgi:hypothetical protein
MGERAPSGTKQRVSACRKRLRRGRAMQRALKLARAERNQASDGGLKLALDGADCAESENAFEGVGALEAGTAHTFTPEVDRHARLRAR